MRGVNINDRLQFLATVILAGYLIVAGLDEFTQQVTFLFTIAFGVLVLAGLLLLLFGFEILEKNLVVIVTTVTPLALSAGLIYAYLPEYEIIYSIFALIGFAAILLTRYFTSGKAAVMALAPVHGIAGMVIFLLPLVFSILGKATAQFAFVGVGGALMGIGGLLLAFLKGGKPILSKEVIFRIFPSLLMLTTLAFVIGFMGK